MTQLWPEVQRAQVELWQELAMHSEPGPQLALPHTYERHAPVVHEVGRHTPLAHASPALHATPTHEAWRQAF